MITRLSTSPFLVLVLSIFVGCGPGGDSTGKPTLQNKGSDTMLEVAQAWAELYDAASVEVSGGGSGVGISFLIAGKVDVANCSRAMKPEEIEKMKSQAGTEPHQIIAGYDALAIYVHKDNPLEEISMEQLAGLFGDSGNLTKWSQLNITIPGCGDDTIELAGRQSSSGTYEYFRESVLGKEGKFKLEVNEQNGSRALVQFVSSTPCAIGYSGMGYKTDEVKFVKVTKLPGGPGILPSDTTVYDKSYPIARPLFLYTKGEPTGHVKDYVTWVRTEAGQAVLGQVGYVSLPPDQRLKLD
ncbi:MAG: phosphate ABC transporter substrate-binding protein [Planctomycetes bacterium]|nr:phosphate ABC transporter substrate-binding protein [Planctomycetota bacterium]